MTVFLWQPTICEWHGTLRNGQTSITDKELSAHPSILTTEGSIEKASVLILATEGWLLVKWHAICRSIMVLPMKSPTTESWKLLQVLFQNNSRNSIDVTIQTSLTVFWTGIMKMVTPFWVTFVTGGRTWIHHYEPESEHWSVKCKQLVFPVKKKFRTNSGKSHAHTVPEFTETSLWALLGKGCDDEWCTLHWDAARQAEDGSSEETRRTVSRILCPHCWKHSSSYALRYWNLHHVALTLLC
jgi:hypothetical protein